MSAKRKRSPGSSGDASDDYDEHVNGRAAAAAEDGEGSGDDGGEAGGPPPPPRARRPSQAGKGKTAPRSSSAAAPEKRVAQKQSASASSDGGDSDGSGERRFVCTDCGFAFKRYANLRVHRKKHLGLAKTFNCERCPGLVFGRIYELRRHNATTHGEEAGDTSARRFVCNDCGTAFNRMDALKRHIRRSQESIPCRVRLGLSGPGELQYEEPMAGQATGPVSPPGHHEAHAAQFLAPMPAAYPDGPYSAVADGHTTLGALLNGATRRLPDPSPAAPAFGAQPFEYGRQSPVYEFVAPSPAGSMRTPHYGHGEYGLPGRNGNAPYGPGTPVPASPLDLLAMVSPEPYSIGANGAAAGSAADRTYSPKAEEAVEDPNLAPANEPPANPVDFVPYPLLAAALLPSLPIPAPLKPLSTLYPNIPASLLPPWPVASYLISQFFEFDYVRMAGLHPPTFYDEVATGRVDPSLLLGTLLSGIRMADPEIGLAKARASGPAWERVFASDGGWARELRDECLHRLFSEWEALQRLPNLELDPASPDPVLLARLTNLMFFCHQCRYNAVVLGLASHHARIMEVFNGLFRLMRFGELAVDSVPPDPRNLPEYIRSEMRSRQCVIYILSDPVKADNSGILPVLYPPPPFERDGQGRWTTGWANMRMCSLPEVFLDALPASSTAPELWAGMLEAERTINLPGPPYRVTTSLLPVLSEPSPYTLGELYFRWSLPRDSPLRRSLSRYVGRGCLRGGYIWLQMAMADMWNRFVRCRRYFLARGWRLHAPPEGVTEEERAARRMRAELAEGTAEFFADLHREIAALVEQADGRGLRDLCEREWGRKWRPCLPNSLVFIFSFPLILNCPSDIFDQVTADESWPYSPQFVEAEALAMTISRITRGTLRVDPDPGPAHPGETPAEADKRYAMQRREEVKRISPVWGHLALRACWVHVVAIRKFRALLHSGACDAETTTAALVTVRNLVDDVDGVLEGLADVGGSFRNIHTAYTIIRNLVEKDIMSLLQPDQAGEAASVWVGPSPEEMEVLRGQLEPGGNFST